jgi:hypothetical protein
MSLHPIRALGHVIAEYRSYLRNELRAKDPGTSSRRGSQGSLANARLLCEGMNFWFRVVWLTVPFMPECD